MSKCDEKEDKRKKNMEKILVSKGNVNLKLKLQHLFLLSLSNKKYEGQLTD